MTQEQEALITELENHPEHPLNMKVQILGVLSHNIGYMPLPIYERYLKLAAQVREQLRAVTQRFDAAPIR